jgi:hypothetical protein
VKNKLYSEPSFWETFVTIIIVLAVIFGIGLLIIKPSYGNTDSLASKKTDQETIESIKARRHNHDTPRHKVVYTWGNPKKLVDFKGTIWGKEIPIINDLTPEERITDESIEILFKTSAATDPERTVMLLYAEVIQCSHAEGLLFVIFFYVEVD